MRQYRSLGAYESERFIYLETQWQTTVGVAIGQEPVVAISKDDSSALDCALRACLDGVRKGVPHPTDWKKVTRPLFAITPFKTDRALMAVSKHARVIERNGFVEFHAYRNEGTREGYRGDGVASFVCRLEDDLAVGLLQALSQATYQNGKTEV